MENLDSDVASVNEETALFNDYDSLNVARKSESAGFDEDTRSELRFDEGELGVLYEFDFSVFSQCSKAMRRNKRGVESRKLYEAVKRTLRRGRVWR